jgi:hypothetical protein
MSKGKGQHIAAAPLVLRMPLSLCHGATDAPGMKFNSQAEKFIYLVLPTRYRSNMSVALHFEKHLLITHLHTFSDRFVCKAVCDGFQQIPCSAN